MKLKLLKSGIFLIFIIQAYCGITFAQNKRIIWIQEFEGGTNKDAILSDKGHEFLERELERYCRQLCKEENLLLTETKESYNIAKVLEKISDKTTSYKIDDKNYNLENAELIIITTYKSPAKTRYTTTTWIERPIKNINDTLTIKDEFTSDFLFHKDENKWSEIIVNNIETLADSISWALHRYYEREDIKKLSKKSFNVYVKKLNTSVSKLDSRYFEIPPYIISMMVDKKGFNLKQVSEEEQASHLFIVSCIKVPFSNVLKIKVVLKNKKDPPVITFRKVIDTILNDSTSAAVATSDFIKELIERLKNE
ncbi:MAG: hypothetical protein KAQ90_06740 [Melioribacteraceae bacterium]|nr:hypothetical protein [Melioribacteraceae bacterium]